MAGLLQPSTYSTSKLLIRAEQHIDRRWFGTQLTHCVATLIGCTCKKKPAPIMRTSKSNVLCTAILTYSRRPASQKDSAELTLDFWTMSPGKQPNPVEKPLRPKGGYPASTVTSATLAGSRTSKITNSYYYHRGNRPAPEDGSMVPGSWPVLYFRVRPEPALFDALAISIARAVSHMPKLAYLNLEFNAHHRGPNNGGTYQHFKDYQGWACYFRKKNSIRFASTCFANEWPHPGPDYTDIERPRLEWVFQCPFREVQWRQPEEADELWRKSFPDVDFDLVTLDYKAGKWFDTSERRREGRVICRSQLR